MREQVGAGDSLGPMTCKSLFKVVTFHLKPGASPGDWRGVPGRGQGSARSRGERGPGMQEGLGAAGAAEEDEEGRGVPGVRGRSVTNLEL